VADSTIIGSTITIRGTLKADEDLIIQGRVDAAIKSTKRVHIDANGVVKADIEVDSLLVSGILVGNATAGSRIELLAGARVIGDLATPIMVIHEGAALRGKIEMPAVDQAFAAPYIEPPVSEKPVSARNVIEKPAIEKPLAEKPLAEKPVTKRPVTERPVTERPVTERPVTEKPVTEKPVTEKPVTEKPAVDKSASEKPVTAAGVAGPREAAAPEPPSDDPGVADMWIMEEVELEEVLAGVDDEQEESTALDLPRAATGSSPDQVAAAGEPGETAPAPKKKRRFW
jgi:cytoskeletal protein CcmA (bactofilin family)